MRIMKLPSRPLSRAFGRSRGLATAQPAVRIEVDDAGSGVRILTLDRPNSLNAMTTEMGDAIESAVQELSTLSPTAFRALVITGAGRAFSAGGDMAFLNARKDDSPTSNSATMLSFYRRFLSIRSLPVPTICSINGPAIGAGACFAMASDVRFTCDDAKIGFTASLTAARTNM